MINDWLSQIAETMPVFIRIRLPLCAFGMSERITFGCLAYRAGFWSGTGSRSPVVLTKFAVLKGFRAFFAAGAGLIVSCLCFAGGIRCLISIGCNFLASSKYISPFVSYIASYARRAYWSISQ